jgi:hypothetical protein|tara:strand:- start:11174 stop:11554 length:381 start_codon:yes stop_codon:yes gene_type:complete
MRPQLLCTFTYIDKLPYCLGEVYKTYTVEAVSNVKCYSYVEESNNVVCIYNVEGSTKRMKDTISINRKKETNTFYSINALNSLIQSLNNGVLDKTFRVDWTHYQDMILLSDSEYNCRAIKIEELSR